MEGRGSHQLTTPCLFINPAGRRVVRVHVCGYDEYDMELRLMEAAKCALDRETKLVGYFSRWHQLYKVVFSNL